jgi:hypothetical protein
MIYHLVIRARRGSVEAKFRLQYHHQEKKKEKKKSKTNTMSNCIATNWME